MPFLSDIGDVLQAPKNALWSVIPGLHDDSGNAYSGSQVAHNLVGTDEDSVWGKALGFGIDVAGDPLTWAAPFIGRGVGAAAKGLGFVGDAAAGAGAATEAAAGAGGRTNALEKALAGLGTAAPEEYSAIGAASSAREAAAEQAKAALMGTVPEADLSFVGGRSAGPNGYPVHRGPIAGDISGQARRYNNLRGVLGDAIDDYGVEHSTVGDLRSGLDNTRVGLMKKGENQRAMFEAAAAGDPVARRGAAKMSAFRHQIGQPGYLSEDLQYAHGADEAIMKDFLDSLNPKSMRNFQLPEPPPSSPDIDIFGLDTPSSVRTSSSAGPSPWEGAMGGGRGHGELSPLLNARRNVGAIKDFGSSVDNRPEVKAALQAMGYEPAGGDAAELAERLSLPKTPDYTGRLVGQVPPSMTTQEINSVMDTAGDYLGSGRARGIFPQVRDTRNGLVFLPPEATAETTRHELMHGLINRAQQTGDYGGLGPLAKGAAFINRTAGNEPGFLRGVGSLVDEMAAHAAEGRGNIDQLNRAMGFLLRPHPAYVQQFARESPLVAALYQHSPELAAGALGAGSAAAAYPFMGD